MNNLKNFDIMDYKEKLELAKDWYNDQSTTKKEKVLLENLFPELTESKDERMKNALIDGLYDCMADDLRWSDFGGMPIKDLLAWLEKQGEQKPAWSDDDEKWIDRACMLLDELNHLETLTLAKIPHNLDDIINHLKSLKNRVQPQPKQEWGKEDEEKLDLTISLLKEFREVFQKDAESCIAWFKSLKNRVQPQPKQEWSINDERILNNIFTYLSYAKDGNKYCTPELICEAENWLKSIKPQPHWKPTDEQIHCFKCVIDFYKTKVNDTIVLNLLNSLYNKLVKL